MKRFLFLIVLIPLVLYSQRTIDFGVIEKLLEDKSYEKAYNELKEVYSVSYRSFDLEYDFGYAAFRNNLLGEARLHFERALLLKPGDSDVIHNINLCLLEQQDQIIEIDRFFIEKWWIFILSMVSPNIWALLALITSVFSGVLIFYKKGRFSRVKFVMLLFSLFFVILSIQSKRRITNSSFAIITQKEVFLVKGASKEAEVIQEIHEGLKVKIIDQIGEWYKVVLPNGENGWIINESIEKI